MNEAAATPVLVLVGPPGAGKSTVGGVLARRLGVAFTDVDTEIETRTGTSISDIFTGQGEPAFRAQEREVVAELLATDCGVLALGGGSVLAESTRALLREHRVVWLKVDVADGVRRTGLSTARPLLAGVNPRATFRALLEARAPLYAEVATIEVDTGKRSANQVAATVLDQLGLAAGPDPEPEAAGETDGDGASVPPGATGPDGAGPAGPGGTPPADVSGAAGPATLPDPVFGRPAP